MSAAACGDASESTVVTSFEYVASGALAAPAVGSDERVVLAARPGGGLGFLLSVDARSGQEVDPPVDATRTPHAPLWLGSSVALVSVAGRPVLQSLGDAAERSTEVGALGPTTPLVALGTDFALASTSGEIRRVGLDGALRSQASLGGLVVGLDAQGDALLALLDDGALHRIAADGSSELLGQVAGPGVAIATGTSGYAVASGDRIVVFGGSGAELAARELSQIGGVIALSDGYLAWSRPGTLVGFAPDGAERFRVEAGGSLEQPPCALLEGRAAVFRADGGVLRLESDGTVSAEIEASPLDQPPVASADRVYGSSGSTLLGFDFRFTP